MAGAKVLAAGRAPRRQRLSLGHHVPTHLERRPELVGGRGEVRAEDPGTCGSTPPVSVRRDDIGTLDADGFRLVTGIFASINTVQLVAITALAGLTEDDAGEALFGRSSGGPPASLDTGECHLTGVHHPGPLVTGSSADCGGLFPRRPGPIARSQGPSSAAFRTGRGHGGNWVASIARQRLAPGECEAMNLADVLTLILCFPAMGLLLYVLTAIEGHLPGQPPRPAPPARDRAGSQATVSRPGPTSVSRRFTAPVSDSGGVGAWVLKPRWAPSSAPRAGGGCAAAHKRALWSHRSPAPCLHDSAAGPGSAGS